MWTVVQIGVCLVFLLLAAFWVGRKLGQRRFYQIREEMRALELSFKNLMEDMEMVSAHNMKVLETRTEEIKELMTITDRKCIYVNDLLKEMDETSVSLRIRNMSGSPAITNIEAGAERKLNKEMQATLESIVTHIADLSSRVNELEDNQTVFDRDGMVNLVRLEVGKQVRATLAAHSSARSEPKKAELQQAMPATERTTERVVPMRPMRETFVENRVDAEHFSASKPANVKELRIASIEEGARMPVMPKKTDLERKQNLRRPPISYPASEVLEMYENGITLPQIARTLNMSKSEIELILKIYGEGINMRKIV